VGLSHQIVDKAVTSFYIYIYTLQDKGPSSVPCELMLTNFAFFIYFALKNERLYFISAC